MKMFLIAALASVTLSLSSFAAPGDNVLEARAKAHFAANYGNREVKWDLKPSFAKATFTENGETFSVYYNADGTLIGSSKLAVMKDIPALAIKRISQRYTGSTLTEAFHWMPENDEARLFVTVRLANDEKLLLDVSEDGTVTLFKALK